MMAQVHFRSTRAESASPFHSPKTLRSFCVLYHKIMFCKSLAPPRISIQHFFCKIPVQLRSRMGQTSKNALFVRGQEHGTSHRSLLTLLHTILTTTPLPQLLDLPILRTFHTGFIKAINPSDPSCPVHSALRPCQQAPLRDRSAILWHNHARHAQLLRLEDPPNCGMLLGRSHVHV